MTAEIKLTESQKQKVGSIVQKLNRKGAFITASVIGNVLRVSASKEDMALLKKSL